LDLEEGVASSISRGIGKMGSAIAGALADNADDDDKGPKTPAERKEEAEDEQEEIKDATPAELRKAANDVANDPQALKKALAASADNPATPINEHMVVEDVMEIAEDDMLGHIKNRISSVQSSKSMSVKETFGHDIKLGTPRNVVKQLAEKYGDPETWQVARTTEGSHYIVSGAIAEEVMAKDTQKQITSLEEEIASVRKKHGDVQEDYKLPQEFKLDTLRGKLQEYNTGYQHQVAKWLSLEEARSIVEMAKKWCGKKKK